MAPITEMAGDQTTLPAAFECAGCLYDLSGAASRICPECGRHASEADIGAFNARQAAMGRIFGLIVAHAVAGAIIAGVFAVGVGLLTQSAMQAAEALVACGVAVCGSMFAGLMASLCARKPERAAYFALWLRTHFWLNAAWLCAPVCGLVVIVALLDSARSHIPGGPGGGAAFTVAVLGFAVWLLATLACAGRWIVVFLRGAKRLCLRGRLAGVAFAFAAGVTLLGAMGMGFAAGALCIVVAERVSRGSP